MFTDAQKQQAKARAAQATRAHHEHCAHGRPSEQFDWDKALTLFKATMKELDRKYPR